MKKIIKALVLLLLCVTISAAVVGCKKDIGESQKEESQKIVKGCANMPRGTKCKEQECCSNRFLCLTGQGSDEDCTSGCSCVK